MWILAEAVVLVLASSIAPPQMGAQQVRREIEYARGLAADWSFVDLAEDVLRDIERQGVPRKLAEEVQLASCEIFSVGASSERDPARRRELFEAALAAYRKFIDDHPLSPAKPSAQAALVDVANTYAHVLAVQQEDAVGVEAESLRTRQRVVLTDAVSLTGDLIAGLKAVDRSERTLAQERELYTLMLDRGQMLVELGEAQQNGTYSLSSARETLEDLIFTAGEDSAWALRAYVVIGDSYAAEENWRSAADFYMAVVEQAIPRDPDLWRRTVRDLELTQGEKEYRWLFVQLATRGLVRSLVALGDPPEAVRWGLHLFDTQRREGFNYEPIGYLSLLTVGHALLDAGGWIGGSFATGDCEWYPTEDAMEEAGHSRRHRHSAVELALLIAKEVNEANRGNNLQLRAQALIAEVISRPGVQVPPAQLFEAAQGDYYARDYREAIRGFRRVLRALEPEDQATRILHGPKTLFYIGACFRRLDRPLEAAMAFRAGADPAWRGDPEFDARNVQGFYDSAIELKRRFGADEVIAKLVKEAENLVLEVGTDDQYEVAYRIAQKLRLDEKYEEAIERFREVPSGEDKGELAQVYVGVCQYELGRAADAEKTFRDYLRTFVRDPKNAPETPVREANRREAMALAEFYLVRLIFERAERDGAEADWREIVELAHGYEERYPVQDNLAPWVLYMTMVAEIQLDRVDEAEAVYGKMVDLFPGSAWTLRASTTSYKMLSDRLEGAPDPEIERKMARMLARGNAGGEAAYGNLRAEARHWQHLEEWEQARRVDREIVERFAGTEHDPELRKFVYPDYGHALLELGAVDEAKEVLAPLVAEGADPPPTKRTILDYCSSVIGWVVEGERGEPMVVPGAGETAAELEHATNLLFAVAESLDEKWSCEWYGLQFRLIYGNYVWSKLDSRKLDTARRQLEILEQELGPSFRGAAGIPGIGQVCDDETDAELRARYGDDVLRRRFVWLRRLLF